VRVPPDPRRILELAADACELTLTKLRTRRPRLASERARRIAAHAARMLGVEDREIAITLGVPPDEVRRMTREPVELAPCLAICAKLI